MKVVGVIVVVAAVACSSHEAMKTDASIDIPPDVCPRPVAPTECMQNGFAQLDPSGTWQLMGSGTKTNYPLGGGSATMSDYSLDYPVTITRSGCGGATATVFHANGTTVADDTVIYSHCGNGTCARLTYSAFICVRASDGQLVYREMSSGTSTMPGNENWSSVATATLAKL